MPENMIRLFDILISGFTLIVLLPLLIPVVIILRITGEGEILFLQERVGKNKKMFFLYKFATMLKDSPNIGTGTVTLKDDPRVLPLGTFLRKTKINELPQLINILKGDMSVIGPRPQTQRCFSAFPELAKNDIVNVRPGLSGIGSVVFRNEENMIHANANPSRIYDDIIMPYKGKLESWYVRNNSVWNYLILIALTIIVVFTRSTQVIFRCYSSIPRPPEALKTFISSDYYE